VVYISKKVVKILVYKFQIHKYIIWLKMFSKLVDKLINLK